MKPNTKNDTNMIEPTIDIKLTKEMIGHRQTNDDMILIIEMFFRCSRLPTKEYEISKTRLYNRVIRTAIDNDISNDNEDKRRPTLG